MSAYLRKAGLKKEIYSIPDKEFYKIYSEISDLKNEIYKLNNDEIKEEIRKIQINFLDIYNYKKDGGIDGNN